MSIFREIFRNLLSCILSPGVGRFWDLYSIFRSTRNCSIVAIHNLDWSSWWIPCLLLLATLNRCFRMKRLLTRLLECDMGVACVFSKVSIPAKLAYLYFRMVCLVKLLLWWFGGVRWYLIKFNFDFGSQGTLAKIFRANFAWFRIRNFLPWNQYFLFDAFPDLLKLSEIIPVLFQTSLYPINIWGVATLCPWLYQVLKVFLKQLTAPSFSFFLDSANSRGRFVGFLHCSGWASPLEIFRA